MASHDFSQPVNRRDSDAKKYDPARFAPDVLPLWIADADFLCPEPVVRAVRERAAHGVYGYPSDNPLFQRSLVHWLERRFSLAIQPDWVLHVPGVMPGLAFALQALSDPGDGVVVQTPAYPPFFELIRNNDRVCLDNPLRLEAGRYEMDFPQLEELLARPRTRLLLLCNPHNPGGRVFTRPELEELAALCARHRVLMVSDEIHCDIVYRGHAHIPAQGLGDAVAAACYSPSKTFNVAGLRCAALVVPDPALRRRVEKRIAACKAHAQNFFSTLAFATAYLECEDYADGLVDYLEGNLAAGREGLEDTPIRLVEPEGTYLLWLDCRALGLNDRALESFFTSTCKVGLNAGDSFGPTGSGFARMNIACPRPVLLEALARIRRGLDTLAGQQEVTPWRD